MLALAIVRRTVPSILKGEWTMKERRKKPKSRIAFMEPVPNVAYMKVIRNGEVACDDEEAEASIEDLGKFMKRHEGRKGTFEITGLPCIILRVEGDD